MTMMMLMMMMVMVMNVCLQYAENILAHGNGDDGDCPFMVY